MTILHFIDLKAGCLYRRVNEQNVDLMFFVLRNDVNGRFNNTLTYMSIRGGAIEKFTYSRDSEYEYYEATAAAEGCSK